MKSSSCAWMLTVAMVLTAAAGIPATAHAAPAANDATALFLKGRKAVEQGNYKEAIEDLRASYASLPSPNTLLLIAHAERGLGNRVRAMKLYEQVEQEASSKVAAGEKRYEVTVVEARKESGNLAKDLGIVVIRITRAPEGLTVKLNGTLIELARQGDTAAAEKVWVEPGELAVHVEADGKSFDAKEAINRESKKELTFDFVKNTGGDVAPAPVVAPTPEPALDEGKKGGSIPMATWIAGGVGVAGLATFAIFGAMAKSKYDDLQSCAPRCDESHRDTADSGKSQQTIANIGLVVGGLGLATAAGFLVFKKPDKQSSTTVGLGVGPGSIQVVGVY